MEREILKKIAKPTNKKIQKKSPTFEESGKKMIIKIKRQK